MYEDSYFYYFWKPHDIPSTFGKQKSFLDHLLESKDLFVAQIVDYLQDMFGLEQELWLLNRLDNDTAGLLYFAKTPLIKEKYKQAQSEWKVVKFYIADVYGNFVQNSQQISYPIWHHKFSKDRVVVLLDQRQSHKIDNKRTRQVDTHVQKLYYDKEKNVTTLLVNISKWVKHQIRSHLSSIWFPIIGEKIYIKKLDPKDLQLFSIWIFVDM